MINSLSRPQPGAINYSLKKRSSDTSSSSDAKQDTAGHSDASSQGKTTYATLRLPHRRNLKSANLNNLTAPKWARSRLTANEQNQREPVQLDAELAQNLANIDRSFSNMERALELMGASLKDEEKAA